MTTSQIGGARRSRRRRPASTHSAPTPQMANIPEVDAPGRFAEFELDPRIRLALVEAGYSDPTDIQLRAIPTALSGRDIIGSAQTGTGKTAAFAIPILQRLLTMPSTKRATRVLVVTPTRELAEQVSDSFAQLGRYTGIRFATVYGGVGMSPQENALRSGVEVIVACPGRLLDHMQRGNTNFSSVDHLVLDEADRMLDMGFLPSIKRIISQLPAERQTMLFSATFASELMGLAQNAMRSPERIDVGITAPAATIEHALYPCPQHLKTLLTLRLLETNKPKSVLVFTRTKHRADRVAAQIQRTGYSTRALHADKSQGQRQSALDDFRTGRCQVLVATDIAARGLDVESISHVINYDVPDCADTYIHRIGRTGRAERTGDAITLVTFEDAAAVWEIERALGSRIASKKVEGFDYDAPAPEKTTSAPVRSGARSARPAAKAPTAQPAAAASGHSVTVYSTPRRRRSVR